MLVGGTGLTEVILPVSVRLASTNNSQSKQPPSRVLNKNVGLSSAVGNSSSNNDVAASTTLLPAKMFGTSAPRPMTSSNVGRDLSVKKGMGNSNAQGRPSNDDGGEVEVDGEERTGFQAYHQGSGSTTAQSTSANKTQDGKNRYHRSNDDRAFAQFVSRERR
jgi:hypothetical protein